MRTVKDGTTRGGLDFSNLPEASVLFDHVQKLEPPPSAARPVSTVQQRGHYDAPGTTDINAAKTVQLLPRAELHYPGAVTGNRSPGTTGLSPRAIRIKAYNNNVVLQVIGTGLGHQLDGLRWPAPVMPEHIVARASRNMTSSP